MIRALLMMFILLVSVSALSQIKAVQIDKNKVYTPKEMKGKIVEAWAWQDKKGRNMLVLTETEQKPVKACEDCTEKELYAYHYISDSLLWRVMDYVRECQFDLSLEFQKGSVRITDLDKDGVAESWFIYRLTCTSDVSPSELKMIMHEGQSKYAVRGTSQFARNYLEEWGGQYHPDKNFRSLSKKFQDFGAGLWSRFLYDTKTKKNNDAP